VATDPVFDEYLSDKLGYLNTEERAVMEPMLKKYRHVFHQEGSNEFKGTDLAEHEIVTGDARPIRKAQYRVPFALRKKMDNKAPKRRASTNFVCVKTTQLPWEGALEARGPAQVVVRPHSERDRSGTPMTSRKEQLTSVQLRRAAR
jgi:hypothetical protein